MTTGDLHTFRDFMIVSRLRNATPTSNFPGSAIFQSSPLPRSMDAFPVGSHPLQLLFMPVFRIHRMKEAPRQQFRWAPHVSGTANVKPKDYEPSDEVEAENEYAAWALLRDSERSVGVGDILETPSGQLRICKYVGFEEARWFVPEPQQNPDAQRNMLPPAPVNSPQGAQA